MSQSAVVRLGLVLIGMVGMALLVSPVQATARLFKDIVPAFSLTERSGRTISNQDLLGKVWIASFVFTRCTGGCLQITPTMERLQRELARYPNVRLVTFTVDPDRDTPDELRKYAERYHANPERWLFLTGKEETLYTLFNQGFKLHVAKRPQNEQNPGQEIDHSFKLAVVDRWGHISGYFDGLPDSRDPEPEAVFEGNLRRLKQQVRQLADGEGPDFPALNAALNALSAALLVAGYVAIRRRLVRLHTICMLSALVVSVVFLGCYLYYHIAIRAGQPTHFADQAPYAPAWVAYLYLGILLSHTLLAVITPPLALYTAYQGLRGQLSRHVRVARWTFPIWLYVSITGVVVYWMLYRLYADA